jgi:hypothetical protein
MYNLADILGMNQWCLHLLCIQPPPNRPEGRFQRRNGPTRCNANIKDLEEFGPNDAAREVLALAFQSLRAREKLAPALWQLVFWDRFGWA